MMHRDRFIRVVPAMALAIATIVPLAPQSAIAQDSKEVEGAQTEDVLIFRDGKIRKGQILSETATEITMMVTVGGIKAEATFSKSDILDVQRDVEVKDAMAAEADDEPAERTATDGAPVVYYTEFRGTFGRDVSATSLADLVEDAKKHDPQPDYLIFKVDCAFSNIMEDGAADFAEQFDQFTTAYDMAPIITDEIRDDPKWVKKPELVFWVKQALGAPAFMVLMSDNIYYTSDAKHGGVGGLDRLFDGMGDLVVREKQRSLRLGRAEGMAARGGHPAAIVRAMTRGDYELSFDLVGGKPVFHEYSVEGQYLLTDNGREENADTMEEFARAIGNDHLRLDAETAYRLGVSKGTVDTLDDLLYELRIDRDHVLIDKAGKKVLDNWRRGLAGAERNIRRLIRELNGIQVEGDYRSRNQARGRMINILEDVKVLLDRYGESINPRKIQGWPDQLADGVERQIQQLKLFMLIDGPP